MILVKPGQKLPLSVIIPDGTSGLVVKAVIEKMDGTVLTTVTLTEVHPGDQKDQSFAMPSGVDFVSAKFSVYESDGVTPQPGAGSFDEIYAVVTPIIASGIQFTVGCADMPAASPVKVVQISDQNLLLQFVDDNGLAVDTSQATVVALRFRKADATMLEKNLSSGISPVAGKVGQYLVQMLAADWALLPTGDLTAQAEVDLSDGHHVMQKASAVSLEAGI